MLVNITASLDMSIGEFEAVGDAVKTFASESATVVVGTVIDPKDDVDACDGGVTGLGRMRGGHAAEVPQSLHDAFTGSC